MRKDHGVSSVEWALLIVLVAIIAVIAVHLSGVELLGSAPQGRDPDMVIQEVEFDPADVYMYVLPDGTQVISVCLNGTRAFVVHDVQDDPSGIAVQEPQSC